MKTSVFVALTALGLLLTSSGDAGSLPDNAKQTAKPLKSYEYIDMTFRGMNGVTGMVDCAVSAPIRIAFCPVLDTAREGTIAASYGVTEVITGKRTVTVCAKTKTPDSKAQPQTAHSPLLKSEQHANQCRDHGKKIGMELFSVAKSVAMVPVSAAKMTCGTGGTMFWTAAEVADGSRTVNPLRWKEIYQNRNSSN